MRFKVDDWVFHDFTLGQIRKIRDNGAVGEFSDGCFCVSSMSLDVLPLTMRTRNISDEFKRAYERIHAEGCIGLNFPDIKRWLVAKWLECCSGPDDKIQGAYAELREFCDYVINSQVEPKYGFPLMRRSGRR